MNKSPQIIRREKIQADLEAWWTDMDKDIARVKSGKGGSYVEVAKKYGVSIPTVHIRKAKV